MLRVHTTEYVEFLETAHARWRAATGNPHDRRSGAVRPPDPRPAARRHAARHRRSSAGTRTTPTRSSPGTWEAATAAVDVTLTAWRAVADADAPDARAYGLCRPPGHHAAADSFAGYCYLNNAAIAAQAWADIGARVAILDVDYHHGNGTQQIFYDRDDVLFVSLHADPADDYPFFLGFASERGWGAGEGYTRNFPLPPGTDWDALRTRARRARSRPIRKFAPDGVVVSLGVDTAAEDPDSFRLVADDYPRIGAAIGALALPDAVVQEGGYALDVLGRNVVNVLARGRRLSGRHSPSDVGPHREDRREHDQRRDRPRPPSRSAAISSARAAAGHGADEARSATSSIVATGSPAPATVVAGSVTMRSAGSSKRSARIAIQNSNAIATASLSRPPGAPSAWRMSCSWVAASKSA